MMQCSSQLLRGLNKNVSVQGEKNDPKLAEELFILI